MTRDPRLLVVTGRFPVMSETFVLEHLRGMADRGWGVTLGCTRRDDRLARIEAQTVSSLDDLVVFGDNAEPPSPWVRVARLAAARQPGWRRSASLRQSVYLAKPVEELIDRLRPDVVHAHFGHHAVAASIAAVGTETPVIVDFHGHDISRLPRRYGWESYRRLLGDHTVVVHSQHAASAVREGMGVEPHLIPYGPSAAFTSPDRPHRWPRPLRLLFVGRLVAEKGPDLAIDALADLFDRRPELDPQLSIVGAGPLEAELRGQVDIRGVGGRIRFGRAVTHNEVAELMRAHDVLLVPSRHTADGWIEAYGRVAAEGVRCSLAVVAAGTGGLPEALGDAGTLVPPDDPGAIADAIEHLVDRTTPAEVREQTIVQDRGIVLDDTVDAYDRLARSLLVDA